MNKNFVNIAHKFLKEKKKDVDNVQNDEYLSNLIKNNFVFTEISDSEIIYISKL